MGSLISGSGRPVVPSPVDQVSRRFSSDPLPPYVAVVGQRDIREYGILFAAEHSVRVRLHGCTGSDSEEPGFRIYRVEPSVFPESHPGDIIADGLDFPAG